MSGDPAVGTSQAFLQNGATAVRGHIVRNRRLFLIAGAAVAGGAIIVAIAVNLLSHPNEPKVQPVVAVAPDIADPLVIMRPSDGTNGTALVLVDGRPLFPLPGSGQLTFDANVPLEAQDVRVEQISSDQGFWIGENDSQRVFVHVAPEVVANGALAPGALQQGQLINVSGRIEPVPADVGGLGVADLELTQLTNQSEMIEANSVRLPTS